MCGRTTLSDPEALIAEFSEIRGPWPEFVPHYNLAPSQSIPIIRVSSRGQLEVLEVQWGLLPWWAKDRRDGYKMINARAEDAAKKSAFREALKKRRCWVLADSFFEWKKMGKSKQPYRIGLPGFRPFALAGLWESWRSSDGEVVETCTILTRPAQGPLKDIHERMPVILPSESRGLWLAAEMDAGQISAMLDLPLPDLVMVPVSSLVNRPENDTPEVLAPLLEPEGTRNLF